MTCREARPLIGAWVDNEVSLRDAAALERHLAVCEACAAEAARQRAFVKALRERLPRAAAPSDVRARLLAGLRPAAETAWAPPLGRLRSGARLAALALASCLLALLFLAPRDAPGAWTQFYRDEHQAHSLEGPALGLRSGSAPEVAAWLGRALGHPVHVPLMPDAPLVGARLCVLRGQTVAMALYQAQGRPLSLFVGDPQLLCPGFRLADDQLYASAGGPYGLVAWRHHGHFHVAVAALDLERLKALARECQVSAI